ncbi:MAG: energy transducer TonB [Burkholderiales bacterium]|nr:energy transducer TonB [Burkholderiales bacterium]
MTAHASSLLPRKFTTGGLIITGHVALFALIALNPVQYLRPAAKETVVMMVPTAMPKQEIRTVKVEKVVKPSNILPPPVIQQLAVNHDSPNAITVAPSVPDLPPQAAPAPVSHAPTIAKAEPVGPKVVNAVEYIQAPQADYPAMARRMGEEGRVVMQVLVNDKGRAEKVEILKSSGFSRLDESAKMALLRALFKPYLEDGKATTILATASINFSLRG